jgi:drug/metabolite transporter (DMT)-like permease
VVILIGWKPIIVTASFGWAIFAGLLAAMLYAIAANYIKRNLSEVPPLGIASMTLLFAPIVLLPALPFTLPAAMPSLPIVASVIGLAIFSTALASIIYLRLINQIGATKVLTVTYLIPLFAMLWGRLFLQEPITPAMALGCGLILCGTAIANRR